MANGYLLPEILETEETVCYTIRVPDMLEYRLAFEGQIVELGYWFNWERDTRKGGTVAAQLWRKVFDTMCISASCETQTPGKGVEPDDAGRLVVDWARAVVTVIVESIDSGDTGPERRRKLTGIITPTMPDTDSSVPIDGMSTVVEDTTPAERADWEEDELWDDMYMIAACHAQPDGSFLDDMADAIAQLLDETAGWLAETLNESASLMTGEDYTRSTYMGSDAGGGGFEPFRVSCGFKRVSTFAIDSTNPIASLMGYQTVVGLEYRLSVSGLVNGDTSQSCLTDPQYVPTRGPSCLPWVKRMNISLFGGGFVEEVEPVRDDHSYWWGGGTGDGNEWGARFNDSPWVGNAGSFKASLWEEVP